MHFFIFLVAPSLNGRETYWYILPAPTTLRLGLTGSGRRKFSTFKYKLNRMRCDTMLLSILDFHILFLSKLLLLSMLTLSFWVMIEILVDVWSLESAFDYFDFSMDTTLVDFNDMKWERGDISFIFNGEAKPNQSLTVLDNKLKVFQRIRYEVSTC